MQKFLILAAMLCTGAHAQPSSILYSGQELYNRLNNDRLSAMGYIAGVADSLSGITLCLSLIHI